MTTQYRRRIAETDEEREPLRAVQLTRATIDEVCEVTGGESAQRPVDVDVNGSTVQVEVAAVYLPNVARGESLLLEGSWAVEKADGWVVLNDKSFRTSYEAVE